MNDHMTDVALTPEPEPEALEVDASLRLRTLGEAVASRASGSS